MSFRISKNIISTIQNIGDGSNLATQQGSIVSMKSLKQGPNIFLIEDQGSIIISAIGGSGGGVIGTITTTSFFYVDLITIPTANNTSYILDVKIVGSNTTNNNTYVFFIKGGYKNIGGTLTKLSGLDDKLSEKQDVAPDAQLQISGINILIQVRGFTANNINWKGEALIQSVSF